MHLDNSWNLTKKIPSNCSDLELYTVKIVPTINLKFFITLAESSKSDAGLKAISRTNRITSGFSLKDNSFKLFRNINPWGNVVSSFWKKNHRIMFCILEIGWFSMQMFLLIWIPFQGCQIKLFVPYKCSFY